VADEAKPDRAGSFGGWQRTPSERRYWRNAWPWNLEYENQPTGPTGLTRGPWTVLPPRLASPYQTGQGATHIERDEEEAQKEAVCVGRIRELSTRITLARS